LLQLSMVLFTSDGASFLKRNQLQNTKILANPTHTIAKQQAITMILIRNGCI